MWHFISVEEADVGEVVGEDEAEEVVAGEVKRLIR
jgi:hypothetical protein